MKLQSPETRCQRRTGLPAGGENHALSSLSPVACRAFSLIELLTVIAIIGVLAAFLLTVTAGVKKTKYINTASAEMQRIETALDNYKARYGAYPPSGTNVLVNPLYYELVGTTNSNGHFTTVDGSENASPAFFYESGFINCSKPGAGGENGPAAEDFLPDLKPNQIGVITNTSQTNCLLVVSVGGPDPGYGPGMGLNTWRYLCPGTNNPNSYDLWVQLSINGKHNLVCNWNSKVQINSPYP
ncbi:MAG: type II secretion system protein [Limisphaerales bacterium]